MECPNPQRNEPVWTFSFIPESKTAFWNIYFVIEDKTQDFKSKILSETFMIDLKYTHMWTLPHTLHTWTRALYTCEDL